MTDPKPAPFAELANVKKMFAELRKRPDQLNRLILLVTLVVLVIWAFWNSLQWAASFWDDPLYSHGWLVPVFALILMWMRREPFEKPVWSACWLGVLVVAAALGLRMVTTHYFLETLDGPLVIPCLLGVLLLVGGWKLLRWAGPPVVFLVFMFPLPAILKSEILGNLQKVATASSTFVLQTLGIAAYREGNRIWLGDLQLGVVEACSGLRMATIFVALAVAIVMIIERPWWDRLVILLSAIPIAVAVNIIRVTVTGILYMLAGDSELAQKVFHDWAGWFMMPLALGLLYIELQVLANLVIEDDSGRFARVSVGVDRRVPLPPK